MSHGKIGRLASSVRDPGPGKAGLDAIQIAGEVRGEICGLIAACGRGLLSFPLFSDASGVTHWRPISLLCTFADLADYACFTSCGKLVRRSMRASASGKYGTEEKGLVCQGRCF